MDHHGLERSFKNKLKHTFEIPYFYYKIPDPVKGCGGLRPFDSILLIHSIMFALEFKCKKDRVRPHQAYYLNDVQKCGGIPLLVEEGKVDQAINTIIFFLAKEKK